MLVRMKQIFVQTKADAELLASRLNLRQQVQVGGDTRYDRVLAIRAQNQRIPAVESWLNGRRALVAGSTWPGDDQLLAASVNSLPDDVALIIAPHEIDEASITNVCQVYPDAVRFSQLQEREDVTEKRILLIDNIGMLAVLYRYASVAWVGGGFEKGGIHNTLEPAVYGIPVLFGPNYRKFHEAVQLIQLGAGFSVTQATEAQKILPKLFDDRALEQQIREKLDQFTLQQSGATERITQHIRQSRYLNG